MLELQPTTCWAAVSDVMVPGSVLASVDHRSRSWIQKLRVGKICRSSWLDHGWNCQNSICTDVLDGIRPIFAPMVGSVFLYHVRSLYLFICEVLFPNQSLDTAVSWLQLNMEHTRIIHGELDHMCESLATVIQEQGDTCWRLSVPGREKRTKNLLMITLVSCK